MFGGERKSLSTKILDTSRQQYRTSEDDSDAYVLLEEIVLLIISSTSKGEHAPRTESSERDHSPTIMSAWEGSEHRSGEAAQYGHDTH